MHRVRRISVELPIHAKKSFTSTAYCQYLKEIDRNFIRIQRISVELSIHAIKALFY